MAATVEACEAAVPPSEEIAAVPDPEVPESQPPLSKNQQKKLLRAARSGCHHHGCCAHGRALPQHRSVSRSHNDIVFDFRYEERKRQKKEQDKAARAERREHRKAEV